MGVGSAECCLAGGRNMVLVDGGHQEGKGNEKVAAPDAAQVGRRSSFERYHFPPGNWRASSIPSRCVSAARGRSRPRKVLRCAGRPAGDRRCKSVAVKEERSYPASSETWHARTYTTPRDANGARLRDFGCSYLGHSR